MIPLRITDAAMTDEMRECYVQLYHLVTSDGASIHEDYRLAGIISQLGHARSSSWSPRAKRLAERLAIASATPPVTCASVRYMYKEVQTLISQLYSSIFLSSAENYFVFETIGADRSLDGNQLANITPAKTLDAFYAAQFPRGGEEGILLIVPHLTYRKSLDKLLFNFRGVASGGFADVARHNPDLIAFSDSAGAGPTYDRQDAIRILMFFLRLIEPYGCDGYCDEPDRIHDEMPAAYLSSALCWLDSWSPADLRFLNVEIAAPTTG
jgi:hypothetical protein